MRSVKLDQAFEEEMSFLDHLEALRWHLIRAVIAFAVCTILAFIFNDYIFDLLLGPSEKTFWTYRMLCTYLGPAGCIEDLGFNIQNTDMAGQFTQAISMSMNA